MKTLLNIISMVLIVLCGGCHIAHQEKTEAATFHYTLPIQQDTILYKEYVSQIHSFQHIELRALERGYLQDVYVDEGQKVSKGQKLFQVMPFVYQSEVVKAQAEVNFAEIEYQNTSDLANQNIVSKSELALTKAKLDKAKAELKLAETHLRFTEIRAPFDGIVGRFKVRQGSLLEEGELLCTLSDNSKMWVYFNVPEAEYLEFIYSQELKDLPLVHLKMVNNKEFDSLGIIETIEADFNQENGNIAFRATFQNPKGILRHSETGIVILPVKIHNALIIPQKSTFEILDKKFVYVVGADGVLEIRQINIGYELPHLFTVIDGVSRNDKILVEGLRKVKNKQKIQASFIPQEQILDEINGLYAE